MRFERRSLFTFNMPYALGTMELDGQRCVVAATEDHGPVVISAPPYESARVLVDGPGGCMSLVPHSGVAGELFAIMGCFLGYNFHGGALYRITAAGSGAPGKAEKVVDLPFGHRMEVVDRDGVATMVLANLSALKDTPQDWSRPGAVYSLGLEGREAAGLQLVLPDIHKNHGFLKTKFLGRPSVLISGTEGVFSLDVGPGVPWEFRQVLDHEVSEIAVFDLDGDGVDELITIEPFHGNVLAIYRHSPQGWSRVWEGELNYGHCVLANTILGRPSVLVSNRAGDKDLLLFQFPSGGDLTRPQRTVIDAGVGAANLLVVHGDKELIFTTNQAQGELVRYQVEP